MTASLTSADRHPTPRATVCIPVYNSAATLSAAIMSARRQTEADIEILVADDGSKDNSMAIAEQHAAEDPRVQLLRFPVNRGKPSVMNAMMQAARGTWLAVLDADDIYRPSRLATLLHVAETCGATLVADNLAYYDAGARRTVRDAFDRASSIRAIGLQELLANTDSFGAFDFGILKPVIRRDFVRTHRLAFREGARLAEDFYFLLDAFVAGAAGYLLPQPLYRWTQPFGTLSRRWTETGSGVWRYNYRNALAANECVLAEMRIAGHRPVVRMLRRRGRQYRVMVHYLDAQRAAADGRTIRAAAGIARHPSTWPLLLSRVFGRARRHLSAKHAIGDLP